MEVPEVLVAADRAPQVAPEHPDPASTQLTPLFCESFVTVAVNACGPPTGTLATDKLRLTTIAGGGSVPPFDVSPHPPSRATASPAKHRTTFELKFRKSADKRIESPSGCSFRGMKLGGMVLTWMSADG